MSSTQTPPVYCQNPRRLVRVPTLRPSPTLEGFGCWEYFFEAHLCGSYVHCDPACGIRLHACSPPRLAATQLARSAVLNRLIAPTGLSPALALASRAHQLSSVDPAKTCAGGLGCLKTYSVLTRQVRRFVDCQFSFDSSPFTLAVSNQAIHI
jgi:hypothetical protein